MSDNLETRTRQRNGAPPTKGNKLCQIARVFVSTPKSVPAQSSDRSTNGRDYTHAPFSYYLQHPLRGIFPLRHCIQPCIRASLL